MANLGLNKSFIVVSPHLYQPVKFLLNASYAAANGDAASLGTDGYATDTLSGVMLGIQDSGIINVADGTTLAASIATDATAFCNFVVNPEAHMKAKISTFTATDPYTTRSSGAAFDIDNTTAGQQFIDAGSTSNDQIKIIGLSTEDDTGLESATGTGAKVIARFNGAKHFLGSIA